MRTPLNSDGLECDERRCGRHWSSCLGDDAVVLDDNQICRLSGSQSQSPSEGEGALIGLVWQRHIGCVSHDIDEDRDAVMFELEPRGSEPVSVRRGDE